MNIPSILLIVSALLNIAMAILSFIRARIANKLIKEIESQSCYRVAFRMRTSNDTEYDEKACEFIHQARSICKEFDVDGNISFPVDEDSRIVELYLNTSDDKFEQIMDRFKTLYP